MSNAFGSSENPDWLSIRLRGAEGIGLLYKGHWYVVAVRNWNCFLYHGLET